MRLPSSLIPAAGLLVLLTLTSCSSLQTTSSYPQLLSKKAAEALAGVSKKAPSTSPTVAKYGGFFPGEVSAGLKATSAHLPKDRHGRPSYSFSDRNRYVRTTAYSHMENEPGAVGRLTAAGSLLKYGAVRSAAADWSRYPLGTKFKIKGLPYTYVVDDYGSALVGTNTIDIFHPTLSLMNKWGSRDVEINVIQWGSWERTVNLLKGRTKYPHCNRMYVAARRHLAASQNGLVKSD